MIQELNIHALWAAAQTAKGAVCVDADFVHRFRAKGGGWLGINRDDGSQHISNLGKFGTKSDWIQTLSGAGAPPIEATPEELAWWLWAFEGGEVTAAVTGPPAKTRHTITPLPGLGKYVGVRGRVGQSQITREQYNDVLISQLVLEGSTANQALQLTPTLLSLDPAAVKGTDPAQALPTKRPFLHAEGSSRFTIDGITFRGHSQFTLTLNLDLQPVYGDDVTIYDLALGNAGVTLGVTVFLDAEGIPQYNRLVYGAAAPAVDARPRKTLAALGSYASDFRALDPITGAANGDKFTLNTPGIKWNIPDRPAPNPDGGTAELPLTGEMRDTGAPAYTAVVECDAVAFVK
jgi:hypothetical protein